MPQLSVLDAPVKGYAGQIAEPGAPTFVRSAIAEVALSAGDAVIRGTVPEKDAAAIAATSIISPENFFGFVLLETSREYDATAPIAAEDPVSILREGSIYLLANEAVTAGEAVGIVKSTGVFVGLGDDEDPPTGTVRLPGCRWEETVSAGATLAVASVKAASGQAKSIVLTSEFLVGSGAGVDIAEQIIGAVPEDCLLVSATYVPSAAITAGTGATAMNLEINKRTAADPSTQVAVAKGSNVDAEAQAWNGDGTVAAWAAAAFTLEAASTLKLLAGDVLSFELIAGATPTYPAGIVTLELRTFA